jgi:hypothetical protein
MKLTRIGAHDYTLYRDYDRGKFAALDLAGRVRYMEARVNRDLIKPCRLALSLSDKMHVGLLIPTLVCSGISAASTFLNGRRAGRGEDKTFFLQFVASYLDDIFRNPTDEFAQWLYSDVRCGLSHSFSLERGSIEGRDIGGYIELHTTTREPQIDQHRFLDDFASGWRTYLDQTRANPGSDLCSKFEARFSELFHD